MEKRYGWSSDLGTLATSDRASVIRSLESFVTRGRDGMAIFVPELAKLDETYAYLKAAGLAIL